MFSTEKSASAHLPAARIWLKRGEALARAIGTAARGMNRWMQRGLSALERGQARRLALRELYALDDRLLQDIGLSREQVPVTVNAMFRREPLAGATGPSREENSGGASQHTKTDASNDGRFKSAA